MSRRKATPEENAGKALQRRALVYAQELAKSRSIRFVEAMTWMKDNPGIVAKDLGTTENFVQLWAELGLRGSVMR